MAEEKKKPPIWEQKLEQANKYNEDDPGQLFQKLNLYGQIKEMYGDLNSKFTHQHKLAKAKRKEVENMVKVYGAELSDAKKLTNDKEKQDDMPMVQAKKPTTDKMREAIAEIVAKPYLDDENHKESLALHYGNKYQSISEQINIMKKRYDHLVNVAKGGV